MFSIVIPAKNEEKVIGDLLRSIRDQTVQPHKIILADKSKDRTREIASAFGVKIVDGDDNGYIGKARNNGASLVDDDIIIFLDADTELITCTTLEDTITCFEALELDIATTYYRSKVSNWKGTLFFSIFNFLKTIDGMLKLGYSIGGGMMVVRKDSFNRIGRFNETLKICEDIDLGWRMVQGRYRFGLLPIIIDVSSRRFTEKSLSSVISSTIGGFGSIMVNVWHINWLKKFKDRFERLYGPTGVGSGSE